ncbi:hypothetical protein ABZ813_13725, partial [Streptomyces sp. NPDC047434]
TSSAEPPAELTWALILGLARHVRTEAQGLRETPVARSPGGARRRPPRPVRPPPPPADRTRWRPRVN